MDAPSLIGILAQTSVDWSSACWCYELLENVSPPSASVTTMATDLGAAIESMLDAMLTVAGTAWNLTE